MNRELDNIQGFDWLSVSLYLALVFIGWAMIYAVGFDSDSPHSLFDLETSAGKQGLWIAISCVVGLAIMIIDVNFFKSFAYPIYGLALLLLLLVLAIGATTKGATSWFNIGSFRFQPSETAKFATCLALASFLSGYKVSLQQTRSQLIALGLIFLPMALVLLQGDAGSALVFLSFFIALFREGFSPVPYLLGFAMFALFIFALLFPPAAVGLGVLAAGSLLLAWLLNPKGYWLLGVVLVTILMTLLYNSVSHWVGLGGEALLFIGTASVGYAQIKGRALSIVPLTASIVAICMVFVFSLNFAFYNVLKPHQQARINVWLQPSKADFHGEAYNSTLSKMAVGSGGWQGKGWLNGSMTKMNYVPEQSTDFIFCTIGEEQGFIGSLGLILIYLILLLRITILAERQRSRFTRVYAYGVAGILSIHLLINIGMAIGLMPIIGIPLPFISYGGSSLLAFTILFAVLIKLDSNRSVVFR
jgi:rod shape determining protein RodA